MELRRATLADFLWEFCLAETQNDTRHGRTYSRGLGPDLFRRVRGNHREGLAREEWGRLRSTVVATRPDYLGSLLSLGLRWNRGRIAAREIGELKVPALHLFRPLAPSRSMQEFVSSLERGERGNDIAVAKNFRRIRPIFEDSRRHGAPIVIGASARGPFTIVEGMTRLSVLWSRQRHAEPAPASCPLVVGIGPRVVDWPFY